MQRILEKVQIDATKEYELLRQEVIKRLEFQNTLLTINTTFVAAFLGFGVKEGYNILILVVPPFELMFALMAKHNIYYMTKIDFFIEKKFETKGSSMLWETFDILFTKKVLGFQLILNLGSYGVYFLYPLIAVAIGLHNSDGSPFEIAVLIIDVILIFLIWLNFHYFNWTRVRKSFDEQVDKRIINSNNEIKN